MNKKIVEVPDRVAIHVDAIAECIREALLEANVSDARIDVARPSVRNALPGDLVAPIMFVVTGSTAWLTKKWADTYVWPRIQKRIDAPSERLLDWLFGEVSKK